MRRISRTIVSGLAATAGLVCSNPGALAMSLPLRAVAAQAEAAPVEVGGRWYRDAEDDDFYYPPEYDLPPPPPVRVYPVPPPAVYEPPVYGWLAPIRPSNCGKYRYWNGERCADARYDPPYLGPRW